MLIKTPLDISNTSISQGKNEDESVNFSAIYVSAGNNEADEGQSSCYTL